jgi:hypothetical protein
VVYCAYVKKGSNAAAIEPNVAMLANALDALLTIGAKLQHVVLFGGGKAYGPQFEVQPSNKGLRTTLQLLNSEP